MKIFTLLHDKKLIGTMWADNREGGGSIFGISIPLELVQFKSV